MKRLTTHEQENYNQPGCNDCSDYRWRSCQESGEIDDCTQRLTWIRLLAIEDILGDEYDLDRLRELAQADREGRCVVLPCKVGDTVYRVVTLPSGPPLLSEMKITTMKQAVSLVNLVGKHKLVSYYLTREEAEAALREAEPSGT